MNVLSKCFGKSENVTVEKSQNQLEFYTASQASPLFKTSGIRNILAIRDLLNDAYPVEMYGSEKEMRMRKRSHL
jgi:hypothetical protein